jgi:hypothetical protein
MCLQLATDWIWSVFDPQDTITNWVNDVNTLKQTKTVITYNRQTREPTIWKILFTHIYNTKILETTAEFEFIGLSLFRDIEHPFIARGTVIKNKIVLTKINYLHDTSVNKLNYTGTIQNNKLCITSRRAHGESIPIVS